MTDDVLTTAALTAGDADPFGPPARLLRLHRQERQIHPLAFPDGHRGWLVTGYAAARQVLSDSRFSARPDLRHDLLPGRPAPGGPQPAPPGNFSRMDAPEHLRYRRMLSGVFRFATVARLDPQITELADECLDAMAEAGPPVELVSCYAVRIPSLTISRLLGLRRSDSGTLQTYTAALVKLDATDEEFTLARTTLTDLLGEHLSIKREKPADDLLSHLVSIADLTDIERVNMALIILIAGYETIANMLVMGARVLVQRPEVVARMLDSPDVLDDVVEELLRYSSIIQFGLRRVAVQDVELYGAPVRAGDNVLVSVSTANRDPRKFRNPDVLDISRDTGGHLGFGHGLHTCLGQHFARITLRIGYRELFRRFPTLDVVARAGQLDVRGSSSTYAVTALPVTW